MIRKVALCLSFTLPVLALSLPGCGNVQPARDSAKSAASPRMTAPGDTMAPLPAGRPPLAREMPSQPDFNTEAYDHIVENGFVPAAANPLSTFSIDVDTASYANVRRFLNQGQLPPRGAVRLEELVNYFAYDYAPPKDNTPFAVHLEVAGCPWQRQHKLVRIGLKGREIETKSRPASNLVFLLDVSGSMNEPNKLPWVKGSMRLLTEQLGENDRVAMVVYAGASGLALPSTRGDQKERILEALERLNAGGSTNGGAGIRLAYDVAAANFVKGGVNRVLLCTDGDFNVGTTSHSELVDLIQERAKSGVFLSVLGFGTGNLKDATMEQLADKGNGNYAYIDSANEARKVLVEQMTGTLITIAKDVKIQVDFNPAKVAAYRLLGYENRMLRNEDFTDDKKDAGEIGAGHTVTAFYEVIPVGVKSPYPLAEPSKYQKVEPSKEAAASDELLTVRLRYKDPDGTESKPLVVPLRAGSQSFDGASVEFRFAAMVTAFGMLLRDSEYKGDAGYDAVLEVAGSSLGADPHGHRKEFLMLVQRARELSQRKAQ